MDTQQQKKFKILLLGDSCTDEYHYGSSTRISPEAPVPVLNYSHTVTKPGMAANVKENLLALGCEVHFVTNQERIVKSRYIEKKSKQHLLRVDTEQQVIACHEEFNNIDADAVVISDYDKGFVTEDLIVAIRKQFKGPMFVDTKKMYLDRFEGCIVKINSLEFERAKTLCSDLIVTKGKYGATYKNKTFPAPAVEVHDVCGAGDTFLSALVYYYLVYGNIETAIDRANKAAALTVQHSGVYVLTAGDIAGI
jgi:D-beta-D-heptose 7-phosphate kinase/D-beta-D-heptose 1-phosphate adenosyltransferase